MHSGGLSRVVSISTQEERNLLSNLTFSNRQKLIECYIPLVKMIIKKYYAGCDEDELFSFGLEKLIACIDGFNNNIQDNLYHYTFMKLKKSMYFYLKRENNRKNSLEDFSEEVLGVTDWEQDFIENETDNKYMEVINEYLKTINENDYKILYMYYNLGYSNEKIGELLNYKANTISARRLRIISRIRVYLYHNGLLEEKDLTIDEKKMARIFKKPTYEEVMPAHMLRKEHPSNEMLEVKRSLIEEISQDNLEDITKFLDVNDLNIILNILKSNTYRGIFGELSFQDLVIICLYFGFFNGKYYSIDKIASFLEIEEEKIVSLIRKVIIVYKKMTFSKEEKHLL